jgi:hypothetical protein
MRCRVESVERSRWEAAWVIAIDLAGLRDSVNAPPCAGGQSRLRGYRYCPAWPTRDGGGPAVGRHRQQRESGSEDWPRPWRGRRPKTSTCWNSSNIWLTASAPRSNVVPDGGEVSLDRAERAPVQRSPHRRPRCSARAPGRRRGPDDASAPSVRSRRWVRHSPPLLDPPPPPQGWVQIPPLSRSTGSCEASAT